MPIDPINANTPVAYLPNVGLTPSINDLAPPISAALVQQQQTALAPVVDTVDISQTALERFQASSPLANPTREDSAPLQLDLLSPTFEELSQSAFDRSTLALNELSQGVALYQQTQRLGMSSSVGLS